MSIDYIRNGESFIAFGLLDPNDVSTPAGLDRLFADGVTLASLFRVSGLAKPASTPGTQFGRVSTVTR